MTEHESPKQTKFVPISDSGAAAIFSSALSSASTTTERSFRSELQDLRAAATDRGFFMHEQGLEVGNDWVCTFRSALLPHALHLELRYFEIPLKDADPLRNMSLTLCQAEDRLETKLLIGRSSASIYDGVQEVFRADIQSREKVSSVDVHFEGVSPEIERAPSLWSRAKGEAQPRIEEQLGIESPNPDQRTLNAITLNSWVVSHRKDFAVALDKLTAISSLANLVDSSSEADQTLRLAAIEGFNASQIVNDSKPQPARSMTRVPTESIKSD